MLLFFDGNKDVEAIRDNHKEWWDSIFKSVTCWSPQLVAESRVVWLNVHGIPLHVWDEPIFKKIGDMFGKFIDFDEENIGRSRLDVARIRVSLVRKGLVDEILKIRVMGSIFILCVVEEGGGRGWSPEKREVVGEDGVSLCSREGEVEGEELGCFSDPEDEPREQEVAQRENSSLMRSEQLALVTKDKREVQKVNFREGQSCV
jgi:hypothetical protein